MYESIRVLNLTLHFKHHPDPAPLLRSLLLAPVLVWSPTIDDDAPSMEAIEQGVKFIQQVLDSGGKVYIHCLGGVGRAPTMCAAYLISQGMKMDEALGLIRKTRPFIQLSPVQFDCLRQL